MPRGAGFGRRDSGTEHLVGHFGAHVLVNSLEVGGLRSLDLCLGLGHHPRYPLLLRLLFRRRGRQGARVVHFAAVGVVSLLDQMDELDTPTTVAVDGTVFECYPYFKERMEFGVELLVGKKRARDIELILAKDGSGVGAAIISALAE